MANQKHCTCNSSTETSIRCRGDVEIEVLHKDGNQNKLFYPNTLLLNGRYALANSLANKYGESYNYNITHMLFGDGGTVGGKKRYVEANRNGLFGTVVLSKPVISDVNPTIPYQAVFTAVVAFNEAVGIALNEVALQMATGDLYSMLTFPDLNKTSDIQLTFVWKLTFI